MNVKLNPDIRTNSTHEDFGDRNPAYVLLALLLNALFWISLAGVAWFLNMFVGPGGLR